MRPLRLARSLIAVAAAVSMLTGCGKVSDTIGRVGDGTTPADDAPVVSVEPPDAALVNHAVVAEASHSVVKIRGVANRCQKILEGSGFVIAPNRVMSNAHVIAGADEYTVEVDGQEHRATPVVFDPNADISVLDVPGLQAPPLDFVTEDAETGTDALVLGYPGGGAFAANPARVREIIELNGPDIYKSTTVSREVYTIRGRVGQGDSGGPLIDLSGRVLGMTFGAAANDPETGFALTAAEVFPRVVESGGAQPVTTGNCVS